MKILKFGGTSVGSTKSILCLKRIIEKKPKKQHVIVAVSTLSGITDKLITTSELTLKGDEIYKPELADMICRHHRMIDQIITDTQKREELFNKVDTLFEQLKSIYYGVFLIMI